MISSASIADDILIKANVRALYRGRYHCHKEIEVLRERMHDKPDLFREKKALRALTKGCGSVLKKMVDKIDDIEFYTCLCKLTHPYLNMLIQLNNMMKQSILPFSGGYLEQPAQIIELLQITDDIVTREESHKQRLLSRVKNG